MDISGRRLCRAERFGLSVRQGLKHQRMARGSLGRARRHSCRPCQKRARQCVRRSRSPRAEPIDSLRFVLYLFQCDTAPANIHDTVTTSRLSASGNGFSYREFLRCSTRHSPIRHTSTQSFGKPRKRSSSQKRLFGARPILCSEHSLHAISLACSTWTTTSPLCFGVVVNLFAKLKDWLCHKQ